MRESARAKANLWYLREIDAAAAARADLRLAGNTRRNHGEDRRYG